MKETSSDLSGKIIGAAIQVHQELGPGYLESIYEEALCMELTHRGIRFERQVVVPIQYREAKVGEHRLDLIVERQIAVELKTVLGFEPIHFAITRSYLKATRLELGLLMNFAALTLQVKRVGREWYSRAE
jgi:GxxExxY protein